LQQVAHNLVQIFGASRASRNEHPFNGLFGRAGQPGRAPHGASFDKAIEGLSAFISVQNVHIFLSLTKHYLMFNNMSKIVLNKKSEKVMGRPKIGTQNAKGVLIAARFTPPEAKQIEQTARRAGLSKSEFVRKRLLAPS
jgi:hypothetical protein